MRFQGLDLNLLIVLDALLKEKSITRAAHRLYVSQPAVSSALKKLRTHYSDPILTRVGRRMEMTPKAKALREPLTDLLSQIEATVTLEPGFNPSSDKRNFNIAMSGYCAEVFGIRLAREIARSTSNVQLQIVELAADALAETKYGHLDFCITVPASSSFEDSGTYRDLSSQPLFDDQFVLAADCSNDRVNDRLTVSDFLSLGYVETRFGGNMISLVEDRFRRIKTRSASRICVPSFLKALEVVSGTPMVTVAPLLLFERYEKFFKLKKVKTPIRLPKLNETLYWHPRSDRDPAHRWLRGLIAEVVEREL